MPKKILIFSHEFPPRLGGAGGVALQLANYFRNNGYEVTVVTQKRKHNNKYNFRLIEIPVIGRLWFLSYFIFFKLHNINQYYKIILNDTGAVYSSSISFSDLEFEKSIVYIHGMEKFLEEKSYFLKFLSFKKNYFNVLNKSCKIIAVSNYIKNRFFKDDLSFYRQKVETIYNGVDKSQFYYVQNNIYSKYQLSKNSVKLLTVARFVKEKGFLKKLEIFEEIARHNNNCVWFIIGDGSFKDEFSQIIEKKKLSKKIFLLGSKTKDELKFYYSESDFFWLLSTFGWVETFGLVYFEAMACKCIPIAWNDKGPTEVIKNGITGCLANSNSEVINFIQDGYKKISKDDLPNQVIGVEDTYTKVLT